MSTAIMFWPELIADAPRESAGAVYGVFDERQESGSMMATFRQTAAQLVPGLAVAHHSNGPGLAGSLADCDRMEAD